MTGADIMNGKTESKGERNKKKIMEQLIDQDR